LARAYLGGDAYTRGSNEARGALHQSRPCSSKKKEEEEEGRGAINFQK
jgi:hypothetical protein